MLSGAEAAGNSLMDDVQFDRSAFKDYNDVKYGRRSRRLHERLAVAEMPLGLIDAILTVALAVATYFLWCLLLRWMTRGSIRILIITIVATGVALWIPFGVYLVLLLQGGVLL